VLISGLGARGEGVEAHCVPNVKGRGFLGFTHWCLIFSLDRGDVGTWENARVHCAGGGGESIHSQDDPFAGGRNGTRLLLLPKHSWT